VGAFGAAGASPRSRDLPLSSFFRFFETGMRGVYASRCRHPLLRGTQRGGFVWLSTCAVRGVKMRVRGLEGLAYWLTRAKRIGP
jgi:hypothetical protein